MGQAITKQASHMENPFLASWCLVLVYILGQKAAWCGGEERKDKGTQ